MLKLIGGLIIITASTFTGFYISHLFYEKVRQLRELQYALQVLESEIIYSAEPLYIAFSNLSLKLSEPLKSLFLDLANSIKEFKEDTLHDIFINSFDRYKDHFLLEKEEIDVLINFFSSLGTSDLEGQKKNFNLTMKKLDMIEKKAEEKRQKNDKLVKYLGIASGILIVVILV